MNMTRKILEGIHEVEFEINPEMQKHQGGEGSFGPEQMLAVLTGNMKDIGWDVMKSVSGGGQPYYVKVIYKFPDLPTMIEVAIGNYGEIQKAVIGNYKDGIYPIDSPTVSAILDRAKKASTWVNPNTGDEPRATPSAMFHAMVENGWKMAGHHQKNDVVTYTFEHPSLLSAYMYIYVQLPESTLKHSMTVTPGTGEKTHQVMASIPNVEYLTKQWLDEKGPKDEPSQMEFSAMGDNPKTNYHIELGMYATANDAKSAGEEWKHHMLKHSLMEPEAAKGYQWTVLNSAGEEVVTG